MKTFPGAICGSAHELWAAKVKFQWCSVKQPPMIQKFDVEKIPQAYAVEVKNRFQLLSITERQPDELREEIRTTPTEVAQEPIKQKPLQTGKEGEDEIEGSRERQEKAKQSPGLRKQPWESYKKVLRL